MSGHSKWHSIKHKKGAADAKRGAIFTKMAKNITIAARDGGDAEMNFKLRMAIDAAKAVNVPKDNIDRAIKKGTGEIDGGQIDEILYEGMGPSNIPVIIKVLTDNRNRAAASIKFIFSKYNGSLTPVLWQFEHKGVLRIEAEKLEGKDFDELELEIIDLGAQDINKSPDGLKIICEISDIQKINEGLEKLGLLAISAQPEYIAKDPIEIDQETENKLETFFELLDDDEDVDDYWTNLKE